MPNKKRAEDGVGETLIEVQNLDIRDGMSLVGFVPGMGDWDFKVPSPFFRPAPIRCSDGHLRVTTHAGPEPYFTESGIRAWTKIGPNGKPTLLLISGIRKNLGSLQSKQKWVLYRFEEGEWSEEYEWT